MEIPRPLIREFPPSETLLLERARRHVDDAMLVDIARADYGNMADEMFVELRPIRDIGHIPYPPSWMLHEVLVLTRWVDPERPKPPPFEPGPTGIRGHYTRLFACAVILQGSYEEEIDSTLAQALKSAIVLGIEMCEAIGSYLTWWHLNKASESFDDDRMFAAVSLLLLAVRLRAGRFNDRELSAIAAWVLSKEVTYPLSDPENPFPRPAAFSLQQGFWQDFADELLNVAKTMAEKDREYIELCAQLLKPS